MGTRDCRRDILAESPVGSVELCSCGSLHLCVGPVSLRIDPVAFLELGRMMDVARERLTRGARSGAVAAARRPIDAS
ncbi:MAG: hypothetical protein V4850_10905 [Myxococcota bacterium]